MNHKALETAVDAHASRLLEESSSPEACVDPNLGPYVTSILRGRGDADSSLVELLESQCGMSASSARDTLCLISEAVSTGSGVAPTSLTRYHDHTMMQTRKMGRSHRSRSLGSESDYDVRVLGEMLLESASLTSTPMLMLTPTGCGGDCNSVASAFSYNSHGRDMPFMLEGVEEFDNNEDEEFDNHEDDDEGCPAREVCAFLLDEEEEEMEREEERAPVPIRPRAGTERHVSFDATHSYPLFGHSCSTVMSPDSSVGLTSANAAAKHFASATSSPSSTLVSSSAFNKANNKTPIINNKSLRMPQDSRESYRPTLGLETNSNELNGSRPRQGENNPPNEKNSNTNMQHRALLTPRMRAISFSEGDNRTTFGRERTSTPPLGNALGNADDSGSNTNTNNGSNKSSSKKSKKKKSRDEANDLAASLFRPSRSRSNSLMDHSPALRPMSAPNGGNDICSQVSELLLDDSRATSPAGDDATSNTNRDFPRVRTRTDSPTASGPFRMPVDQIVESTAQLLLTMNSHLSHQAATHASLISNGDLNLAQYIVEAARSAPPICRHLLKGACYRSDCAFSHDIEGHTCLFWLRGRCSRGDNSNGEGKRCRFLHGFSKRLLEGIHNDYLKQQQKESKGRARSGSLASAIDKTASTASKIPAIRTANLLQYNSSMLMRQQEQQRLSTSLPKNHGSTWMHSALLQGSDDDGNGIGFTKFSTGRDTNTPPCNVDGMKSEYRGIGFVGDVGLFGSGAEIWSASLLNR